MSTLHVRAQTVVTEDDSIAFLAFLLRLAAFVYIADVSSQCVGLDKLFRAGRALVLQLRIVLHFVPLELVEPRHNSLTDRTGDVKSLFLSRRLRDGQPLPSVGGVVNSKVRQTKENFFATLKIALEGRSTIAGMMSPEVVGSGKCFVTLLALERFFQARDLVATVLELLLVHVRPQFDPVFVGVSEVFNARMVFQHPLLPLDG